MRYGPFIFLGLLLALSLSWLGMVATPQLQFGDQQPTNLPPANIIYPTPFPGLANVGRDVYRANGCAYCHTQVVRQEGALFDVVIVSPGTNEADVVAALLQLKPGISPNQAQALFASPPATVLTTEGKPEADVAQKALSAAGAEAAVRVVPTGPDIQRGWGMRLSVAHDYIYDRPLMLGEARIGPDLTNVGLRRPDPTWHLLHLYDPKIEVAGSIMPRYPFLFTHRPRQGPPASDALPVPGDQDVIPTPQARALVAYLLNLRTEMPLFEAPGPQLPAAPVDTNAVPGSAANTLSSGTSTNPAGPNQPAPK